MLHSHYQVFIPSNPHSDPAPLPNCNMVRLPDFGDLLSGWRQRWLAKSRHSPLRPSTPSRLGARAQGCEDGTCVLHFPSDSHYLVRLHSPSVAKLGKNRIGPQLPAASFYAAAVIHVDGSTDLDAKIQRFCADEDFERHFLDVVVLFVPYHDAATKNRIRAILRTLLAELTSVIAAFVIQDAIPEGPYFARDGKLHQTWRLYPDTYEAFHLPTIHGLGSDKLRHTNPKITWSAAVGSWKLTPDRFIGATVMHDGKLMVPVPSRLHTPKSEKKPFNGLRLTVKEVIDLAGVKTSGQSRSYERLYPPRNETALMVKRLVDLGAVVIGKTKCTQFASSDQPTADWVDYHASWNPRGDGYLSPRGSSTGTCVALAGYSWSDVGLGSDSKVFKCNYLISEPLCLTDKQLGAVYGAPPPSWVCTQSGRRNRVQSFTGCSQSTGNKGIHDFIQPRSLANGRAAETLIPQG
jgi:hypothetical protein